MRIIDMLLAALLVQAGAVLGGPSLVGHWVFDGCDGKTVLDRSGNGNDGIIAWGELRAEKGTTSLALDGMDGHVRIAWKTPANLRTNITSVIWVRPQRLRNNTVLFGIPNPNPDWTTPVFGMYAAGGRVVYGQFGDRHTPKALVESASALPSRRWSFVAATSDGETLRLYVNGKFDAELNQRAILAFNGNPLLIGAGMGSKPPFKGRVGELRIYSRALTAAEIQAVFENTRSAYEQEPVATQTARDGAVPVETHGSNPESPGP